MTRVSLTGTFHDLLAKLRICCYGSTTTFIVKNAILKPKLNGLMYFELWFYFAFKSKQKWNQQIINKKKFQFLLNKEFSPFAWYGIIMISREFSKLSELSKVYRARVARIVVWSDYKFYMQMLWGFFPPAFVYKI